MEQGTYDELMAAGGELMSLVRRNEQEEQAEAAAVEADTDLGSDDEVADDASAADEGVIRCAAAAHVWPRCCVGARVTAIVNEAVAVVLGSCAEMQSQP